MTATPIEEDVVTDPTTDTEAPVADGGTQQTMSQPASQLLTPAEVRQRLQDIRQQLSVAFYERSEIINGMLLATLAKQHAFILGPPGTAKSMLTRAFFAHFPDARYFEAILSKTRPAEAILGPYDIPELRDNGHLFRKIKNFLPDSEFAMLDEVGKMSPTLGHDLLAVVLERRLHQVNGGRSWVDVPLYTFIGGSNELPTEESDDAAALWDRILVRMDVDYIQENGNFAALLSGSEWTGPQTVVDFASLAHVIDNEVPAIKLPTDVVQAIVDLKATLLSEEVRVSDRRWRQSVTLLKAAAWLAGRDEVTTDDIAALRFSLWDLPQHKTKVERLTLSVSNPFAEAALGFEEKAREILAEVQQSKGLAADKRAGIGVNLNTAIKTLVREISNEKQKALSQGASTEKLDEVVTFVNTVRKTVLQEMLDMEMN